MSGPIIFILQYSKGTIYPKARRVGTNSYCNRNDAYFYLFLILNFCPVKNYKITIVSNITLDITLTGESATTVRDL